MKKIRTQNETKKPQRKTSFTLLEVIIVTAIISIGAAVVMFVLNPPELLAKARDSQRMSDMAALKTALGVYFTQVSNPDLDGDNSRGTCGTNIWLGRADAMDITDTNVGYLTLHASGDSSSTAITGSGWLPVNFSQTTGGSPVSALPLDPGYSVEDALHVKDTDYFYLYTCNTDKTYELSTNLESQTYAKGGAEDKESTDGGNDPDMYEVGINTSLIKDISATASWVGVGGMVTYNSGGSDSGSGVVVDAGGSIYVVGSIPANGGDIAVRKYNPNGSLDTTWGSSGMVTYNSGGVQADAGKGIAIDSDTNVYIAGSQGTNGTDFVALKYNSTGTLDTAWGISGKITYNSGGAQTDVPNAIAVDANKNMYIAGYQVATTGYDWVMLKYDSSGSLDTSWGSSGMVTYNSRPTPGYSTDIINSIAVDVNSNVYAAGYANMTDQVIVHWRIHKYNSSGSIDASWGSSGVVTYYNGNYHSAGITDIALDQNNNLYAVGWRGVCTECAAEGYMRKYDSGGNPATAWGSSGAIQATPWVDGVVVDSGGNMYIAGDITDDFDTPLDWYVVKYTSLGALSGSWPGDSYDSGLGNDGAFDISMDLSGNVYVAGSAAMNSGDWAVRKYTSFGVLDNQ